MKEEEKKLSARVLEKIQEVDATYVCNCAFDEEERKG